ncbi:hypothetical protein BpHYR1_025271 [Brachionus plicatilis]|uniref:Uncharacterized protein n=1 Tax=Brachionus plicatilis TaxID=10195 RepID=A0A3M7Q722_BRAPC|nr:hypothetical protein BpHYR1_025271 [Brachionus plicatilis]
MNVPQSSCGHNYAKDGLKPGQIKNRRVAQLNHLKASTIKFTTQQVCLSKAAKFVVFVPTKFNLIKSIYHRIAKIY